MHLIKLIGKAINAKYEILLLPKLTIPFYRLSLPLSPRTVKSVEDSCILLDAYDTVLVLRSEGHYITRIIGWSS